MEHYRNFIALFEAGDLQPADLDTLSEADATAYQCWLAHAALRFRRLDIADYVLGRFPDAVHVRSWGSVCKRGYLEGIQWLHRSFPAFAQRVRRTVRYAMVSEDLWEVCRCADPASVDCARWLLEVVHPGADAYAYRAMLRAIRIAAARGEKHLPLCDDRYRHVVRRERTTHFQISLASEVSAACNVSLAVAKWIVERFGTPLNWHGELRDAAVFGNLDAAKWIITELQTPIHELFETHHGACAFQLMLVYGRLEMAQWALVLAGGAEAVRARPNVGLQKAYDVCRKKPGRFARVASWMEEAGLAEKNAAPVDAPQD